MLKYIPASGIAGFRFMNSIGSGGEGEGQVTVVALLGDRGSCLLSVNVDP